MSDTLTLAAETRDQVGKGASRSLRREGRVPAVIYGQNKAAASIHLEEKALVKALMTGHFFTSVIMVDGQRTLAKDVAFHPVTDRPLHVDFLRIGEHETVTVAVPVVFTDEDESRGIKQGGVLNVTRHEIEIVVDAADIPAEITISLKRPMPRRRPKVRKRPDPASLVLRDQANDIRAGGGNAPALFRVGARR